MRKPEIIVVLLFFLCVIGLFTSGISSFLFSLLIFVVGTFVFTMIFRFITRPVKEKNYQKAVKQSQKLRKSKQKKNNSSFKVIDGGKK